MIGEPVRLAGHDQRRRFVWRACVFASGVALASGALATLLGFVGQTFTHHGHWLVALLMLSITVLIVAADLVGITVPVPQRRWQVPRTWLQRFWLGSFGFGLVMGAGIFTYTPSLLFYAYLAICVVNGSALGGLTLGIAYGATFSTAVFVSTRLWRRLPPGAHAEHAISVLSRARFAGAVLFPLTLGVALGSSF